MHYESVALSVAALIFVGCTTTNGGAQSGTFHYYGEFCGPGIPRMSERANFSEQLAALQAMLPRDDVDALCKAHDTCYVEAAQKAASSDVRREMERCDKELLGDITPMREYFKSLHARFGVYLPSDESKPTEREIQRACERTRYTKEDFSAGFRQLYPTLSEEQVEERAEQALRAHCAAAAQLPKLLEVPERERKLVKGLIQYGRCSVVADGITRAFDIKSLSPQAIAMAPLSAALYGFRWSFEGGLPGPYETCNAEPDAEMLNLLKEIQKP